jgi:hypothetical protein
MLKKEPEWNDNANIKKESSKYKIKEQHFWRTLKQITYICII